jgi:predicted transcriptional regulator
MIHEFSKVTIVRIRKPHQKNVNDDLQWLCSSLGLFSMRDKNSSCFRVFVELLKTTRKGIPMSSDELAVKTGLSRGTVVHHLHSLISAGLVIPDEGKYILRDTNLESVVREVRQDLDRVFEDLKKIAEELDKELQLEKR